MGVRSRTMERLARFTAIAGALVHSSFAAADDSWFADVERFTNLRETRLDVAGPESASFTALGVAPFVTAQALASGDLAVSVAQVFDDYGNPRAALGIDFSPTLLSKSAVTLGDYQRSHAQRIVSRLQLSLAVSRGESADDRSTRVAPTLRIVFHEQRDSRVHRGPGSLQECFERHVKPPEAERAQLAALTEQLPKSDNQQHREEIQAQWSAALERYRAALQETVRQGMEFCRDDPEVAAYTWNATGFTLGISPSFRDDIDDLGALKPKGLVMYATQAFGFDALGRLPTYVPTFLGSHVQVLTQVLYRLNEPQLNPLQPGDFTEANELVGSVRLRAGTSRMNANLETAVIHDWITGQKNDTLTRISLGLDTHLARGVWLSLSVGRTLWRDVIPNQTSGGLGIKWTLVN